MMTWRLAKLLQRRSIALRVYHRLITENTGHVPVGWITVGVFLIFFAGSAIQNARLGQAVLLLAALGLLVTLLNGVFQGAIATVHISSFLAKMREQRLYDLLCLLPPGTAATQWSLCAVYMQRSAIFDHLGSEVVWIMRFLFSMLVVMSVAQPAMQILEGPILALVQVMLLCVAFYLDDLQSLVVCILIGQISPTYARSPADARLYALSGYFFVQLLVYLLTWLLAFTLLPAAYAQLNFTGLLPGILHSLVALGLFYGIREAAVQALWRLWIYRLDISPKDTLMAGVG